MRMRNHEPIVQARNALLASAHRNSGVESNRIPPQLTKRCLHRHATRLSGAHERSWGASCTSDLVDELPLALASLQVLVTRDSLREIKDLHAEQCKVSWREAQLIQTLAQWPCGSERGEGRGGERVGGWGGGAYLVDANAQLASLQPPKDLSSAPFQLIASRNVV